MDKTTNSIDKYGENWNTVIKFKGKKATVFELERALTEILPSVRKYGLPLHAVDSILDILNNRIAKGDEHDLSVKFLHILIPNETLTPKLINKFIQWFESGYQNNFSGAKNFTYWLLVSLKVGVITKDYLRKAHYQSLFHLLLENPQDDALSFCLKEITQSHHVTELSLKRLHDCYKAFSNKRKSLAVLLKKYIRLMPQLAEALKIKKVVDPPALKLKDKIMDKSLQSFLILHIRNKTLDDTLNNEEDEELSFKGSYFNMTPIYTSESGIKVTSLTDYEAVIKHYDSLAVPCNMVSLLGNKCGQFYVSFASLEWQRHLEEQVSAILRCLLNNRPRPEIDYNFFLKALVETQAICSHGMPSVSKFLTDYLMGWDGCKYRDGIIGLIPWFNFRSFHELETFMKNLFNVFISLTLDGKIKIIDAFSDLYLNMWISSKDKKKINIPFVGTQPPWVESNLVVVIECVAKYFQAFIFAGFVAHKSDPAFLSHALMLYYKIFLIEKKFNFCVFTILPQMVVLLSQTSSCVTILNLLCKILFMYLKDKETIAPSSSEFEVLNLIHSYSLDTVRILLHGVEEHKLERLMLGRLFTESDAVQFSAKFAGFKDLMSVPKHFATTHIVHEIAKKLKISVNKIKPERFVDFLELIAPDCAALVKESVNISDETTWKSENMSDELFF